MNKNSVKNLGEYAKKGGPGRPKTGRRLALDVLDAMLAKKKNQTLLQKALQQKFESDPAKFFLEFIAPLLPKNVELSGMDGEPIETINLADLSKLSDADLKRLQRIKQNLSAE